MILMIHVLPKNDDDDVRDPHHRESPRAGFEPAQSLSPGLVE